MFSPEFLVADVCKELGPILGIVNFIVNLIMIGVPIALIIYGMIDLGKAVISSKEDEVKKATKLFFKRFLYAVGVFAVVWIVQTVFSIVAKSTGNTINPDQGSWLQCRQNSYTLAMPHHQRQGYDHQQDMDGTNKGGRRLVFIIRP